MDVVTAGAAIAAVGAGVIEAVRRAKIVDIDRWGGLIALALGVIVMVAAVLAEQVTGTAGERLGLLQAGIAGATAGLSAAGINVTVTQKGGLHR